METSSSTVNQAKKNKWKKRLAFTGLTLLALFIAYVFMCGLTYSSGARTGVVIKISKKGYLFKTCEGELNLGGFSEGDGTIMPTRIWQFSVQKNDTAVYNILTNTQGRHVRLYYKEVYKNFFWQSETPYFVERVEIVK